MGERIFDKIEGNDVTEHFIDSCLTLLFRGGRIKAGDKEFSSYFFGIVCWKNGMKEEISRKEFTDLIIENFGKLEFLEV